MKIKNLLLTLMACAAITACSNNELLTNDVDDNLKGDAFVAVNIVSNGSAGSKALGSTEEGTALENKVNSAMFFFFDANGNGCATPAKPNLDFTDEGGNPSLLSKAVLVLENAKSIPASIVAVMNPSSEIAALGATTSLTSLRSTVAKATAAGTFIMSNAAYAEANQTLVDATPISAANIASTEADALARPVNIPVERVVAKVNTTLLSTPTEETFPVNNVETKIKVKLLGWKVTALNPESNLIKNIDPAWNMSWWNDATSHRSFWGTSRATSTYTYFPYDAIKDNKNAEYCLENTSATATKLIVAAQLQTEAGAPLQLMEWKGSKNTAENMKIVLANTSDVKKYYTKTGEDAYTSLSASLIDFTTEGTSGTNRYSVIATLAKGAPEIYTISGQIATKVEHSAVNATLKALGEIKYWNNGASYFYIDIEHNGGTGVGSVGIIRNHSYKLNVTAVSGLGTPVPDPGKEIIPEKPTTDDQSYIAATVQVLGWKIITQEVSLTDK